VGLLERHGEEIEKKRMIESEKYWNTSLLYRNKTRGNTVKTVKQYGLGKRVKKNSGLIEV
jgi:hypothetical protein